MLAWTPIGHYQVVGRQYRIPVQLDGAYFSVRPYILDYPDANNWIRGGFVAVCDAHGCTLGKRLLLNQKLIYRSIWDVPAYQIEVIPPTYILNLVVEIWQSQSVAALHPQIQDTGHSADLTVDFDFGP